MGKLNTSENKRNAPSLITVGWSLLGLVIFMLLGMTSYVAPTHQNESVYENLNLEQSILPRDGVILPITWGNLGAQMIGAGVIDEERFVRLYDGRGGLSQDEMDLLVDSVSGQIVMTEKNAGVLLNLLWAFGLSNKNEILEEGPMANEEYGGDPSGFASTGGWSLAAGNSMNHYSNHRFISLTAEQQNTVERVAKGMYRPCCGNSTFFPDCNHGMAMLGLLELMAYNDLSEDEMYDVALSVNSYWFPDTYMTLAMYFEQEGVSWDSVDPKVALGADYSSSRGYQHVLNEIEPVKYPGGGSCSA